MTGSTCTDRYVAAAMRTVPESQRADLAAELRASIDDQIDARIEDGTPQDEAERDVLTGLGDPDKLAAGYTDRSLYLIGPRYYLEWWRLLKLLLWIVLPCAVLGVALGQVLAGVGIGEIIGTAFAVLTGVTVHLFFWTALVFAIVERSGADASLGGPWTVDSLPELRERGTGFGDMVASLVFLLLAAGAIVWDHFVGLAWFARDAATATDSATWQPLSVLDDGLWPWGIAVLFALMIAEGVLSVVVHLRGRWTVPLAIVNTVLALAVAIPAIVLLTRGELIDPDLWARLIPADSAQAVDGIVTTVIGFAIAGIALWDIADVAIKTVRARR
ncbi:permease prefix domain 1-containing protein [Microbacterium sp. 18062]|uniref:permease prefix domain 1-containing protein n=1 Tax=Microbacterium sp. 18062 TaxID=2681410 RepID=UPI00135A6990|nr:permease prefix domain 1-containing protein [Microbacterium sp. 18062]